MKFKIHCPSYIDSLALWYSKSIVNINRGKQQFSYIYHVTSLWEDAICKSRNYRQIIPDAQVDEHLISN